MPPPSNDFVTFYTVHPAKRPSEVCYTFEMQKPGPTWSEWAITLQKLKLDSIAAWLIEAGAPLTLLGAQALYFSAPLLGKRSEELAALLEDESQAQQFVAYLRGEKIT